MANIDAIEKAFEPSKKESEIYQSWEKKNYFHAQENDGKPPFSIVMPPPNITGQLHMGHALDNTIQDVLTRFKRMQGYSALWMPGTDHAAIATEAKIVESMKKDGITKDDLGREGFLIRAWEWKKQYGGRIVEQLKRLGSSCDWERERFTMDEGLSEAVLEVFIRLYNEGLIYKGERIINWCPHCLTSISDAEVEYEEQNGSFWHIRYPLADGSGSLELATTRPETLLGDTAVAVHPKDERYKAFIGKMVTLPLTGREIPVIADEYVEMDFGTGVVKITPAHDPNDFEVGLRHDLPVLCVMTPDAHMNELSGVYEGLERYAARKQIVSDLEDLGLLIKVEPHRHDVGTCYRCGTTVEPRVSLQWFVSMKKLAEPAIQAVRDNDISFVPDRFNKMYFNWMENIRDWCISRQLWWGHQIPAYYCDACGEIVVGKSCPDICPKCKGTDFTRDEDTLDTWFSSALWPFSTLGWPQNTAALDKWYPTDVLVTGYDIITFWVSRMIFSGLHFKEKRPFETVLIHGLVRDSQGRKMSKSLGNGIDPLEIIDTYGADALRYSLLTGNSPGNDLRFQEEKLEAGRNFVNKLWNAMRFVLLNTEEDVSFSDSDEYLFKAEDKWILSRFDSLVGEVTANLDRFEIGIALSKLYSFLWEEYCDWYIEMSKARLYDGEKDEKATVLYVLHKVLSGAMQLLHPFMPFMTEEIYGYLKVIDKKESIMISDWPKRNASYHFPEEERKMSVLMDGIRSIRNVRTSMNVPPSKKAAAILVPKDSITGEIFSDGEAFLERLSSVSGLSVQKDNENIPSTAVAAVFDGGSFYLPMEDLIDLEKEKARLSKELENIEKELSRVLGKLENQEFVSKAPEKVIQAERDKKEKYEEMLQSIKERLSSLLG